MNNPWRSHMRRSASLRPGGLGHPERRHGRAIGGTYGAHLVQQAISEQRLLDLSPSVEGETSMIDVEKLHTHSTYVRESNL